MTEERREESIIILSDRCYWSLEQQQEQIDCTEGDFHRLKTLTHKGEKHLRKLLHYFEWEDRVFIDICSVFNNHFFEFSSLFEVHFVFDIGDYVGSHQ